MQEISMWFSRWSEGNRKNLLATVQKRSNDSYLDEVIIALKILIFMGLAITAGFGIAFHYYIFLSASGKAIIGVIMSCLFFIAIEICKIFFGIHFVNSLFNMVWWKSLYKLAFTLGLGVLVFSAFKWSINISTKGVSTINSAINQGDNYRQGEFIAPASVNEIDQQLNRLENAKDAGGKSTWKGRTTREGLEVIQSNTKLQEELLRQRSILMANAMARHDSIQVANKALVLTTSSTLLDWGGKAEYATMIFIFLLVIAQNIYYDELVKKGKIEDGKK